MFRYRNIIMSIKIYSMSEMLVSPLIWSELQRSFRSPQTVMQKNLLFFKLLGRSPFHASVLSASCRCSSKPVTSCQLLSCISCHRMTKTKIPNLKLVLNDHGDIVNLGCRETDRLSGKPAEVQRAERSTTSEQQVQPSLSGWKC